jgi:hypothetical protein
MLGTGNAIAGQMRLVMTKTLELRTDRGTHAAVHGDKLGE